MHAGQLGFDKVLVAFSGHVYLYMDGVCSKFETHQANMCGFNNVRVDVAVPIVPSNQIRILDKVLT